MKDMSKYELKMTNGSFVKYITYNAISKLEAIEMYRREYGGGQAWELNTVYEIQDSLDGEGNEQDE